MEVFKAKRQKVIIPPLRKSGVDTGRLDWWGQGRKSCDPNHLFGILFNCNPLFGIGFDSNHFFGKVGFNSNNVFRIGFNANHLFGIGFNSNYFFI